jgi:N-acetylmuramate 1-kinase
MAQPSIDLAPLSLLIAQTFPQRRLTHIEAMPGGMSSRRFFRVTLDDDGQFPRSLVATFTPDANKSDEVTATVMGATRDWPFVEIQRTLAQADVRVPMLFGKNCDDGWLLLEDLGELTLAETLRRHPQAKESLYRLAVRDLARAQQRLEHLSADSIVRARRFDEPLLLWEIEHFRQYALEARAIVLTSEQAQTYEHLAKELAERVARLPYGFVHRDYQSRNLMWLPQPGAEPSAATWSGELAWIDFQDALTGPRVYDLVALLNDSYQTFSRDFVEQRLQEFTVQRGLPHTALPQIVREFDTVTVQRKLKDAGRFVYFQHKNGDDSYLRFVEPTIAKIKSSLARMQDDPLFRAWSALLDSLV